MTEENATVQKQRLVEEFLQLVQVDSETRFERQICDVLKPKFSALNFDVLEDDSAQKTGHGAGNLIMTLAASPRMEHAPSLLFTCHMDTVIPGKGISPQVDSDGYIRSDGTTILGSDDKAGIAALLEVFRVIKEHNIPHGKVQVVITVGEEAGLIGAMALDPKHLDADLGFALDSNLKVGAIAVAAPHQARILVTIHGKSAHAGVNPEDGVSAIQVASKAISRMPMGRIDFETSANIGSFEGRGPTNIVCDRVDIHAEARSIRKEKLDEQLKKMNEAFDETAKVFGARAEFNFEESPGFYFRDDDPIVNFASKAIQKVGRKPHTFHSGGGSDANIFNHYGIPTVNLAVGYEHIHTTKEQMPIEELVKTAELILKLIEEAAIRHEIPDSPV